MDSARFFDVPRQRVSTSAGEVELPVQYRDFSEVAAFVPVDPERAQQVLAETPVEPVRFVGGACMAVVTFYDYLDTSIGPYRECGVSLMVVPRGQVPPALPLLHTLRMGRHEDVGAFVLDLPVTGRVADVGGRELWGFPKFCTPIEFQLEERRFRGVVLSPEGTQPLLTLEGRLGLGVPLPALDVLAYTQRGPELLRTLVQARGTMSTGLGGGLWLRVGPGVHPMAERLRSLGLDGARPAVVQAGVHLGCLLPAGRPLAAQRAA